MPSLFGVDIAGIVATELGGGLLPATLRVYTYGARTEGNLTAGPAITTQTSTAARGVISDYTTRDKGDGTTIQIGDRKVLLLGATLDGLIPVNGSQIDIEGTTYVVQDVQRDPAAATYVCQARPL